MPEMFKQRLKIVTETAGLDRKRLLMWTIAWCGLSAVWSLESNDTTSVATKIAELALFELHSILVVTLLIIDVWQLSVQV